MTKTQIAIKKALTTKVVGPFLARQHPPHSGLYLRISSATGEAVWAYYNADARTWGLYSNSKKGAMKRRHKASKKSLPWFAHQTGRM